jgi:hypothetical protein
MVCLVLVIQRSITAAPGPRKGLALRASVCAALSITDRRVVIALPTANRTLNHRSTEELTSYPAPQFVGDRASFGAMDPCKRMRTPRFVNDNEFHGKLTGVPGVPEVAAVSNVSDLRLITNSPPWNLYLFPSTLQQFAARIDFNETARQSGTGKGTQYEGEGDMENIKCPTLVNKKECGLALILTEQDLDTETEVYECALGHRKYVLIGETEKRICPTLKDGKPCGLALSSTQRDPENATEIYECALGHRIYVPIEPQEIEVES